jgi:hypothetical protein
VCVKQHEQGLAVHGHSRKGSISLVQLKELVIILNDAVVNACYRSVDDGVIVPVVGRPTLREIPNMDDAFTRARRHRGID